MKVLNLVTSFKGVIINQYDVFLLYVCFKVHIWEKNHRIVGSRVYFLYILLVKFVLESILVRIPYILMVLGIFYHPITCFYVCVLYVLYNSWVNTDLSVSTKTTTNITLKWSQHKGNLVHESIKGKIFTHIV